MNEVSNKEVEKEIINKEADDFNAERRRTMIDVESSPERESIFDLAADYTMAANNSKKNDKLDFTNEYNKATRKNHPINKAFSKTLDSKSIRAKEIQKVTKISLMNDSEELSMDGSEEYIEMQHFKAIEKKFNKYYKQLSNLQVKHDSYLFSLQAVSIKIQ